MTNDEIRAAIEAILFASGEPLEVTRIAEAMELDVETVRGYIFEIGASLDSRGSGICLLRLGDKFQLCSRTEYAPLIRNVLDIKRNIPLSNAALEVLAVVAYNQPVTKAYIEQVRGVDCSGVVNTLCQKGLLEERGRLELPEKPAEMMIAEQDDEIDSSQGEQIRNFFQAELENAEQDDNEE